MRKALTRTADPTLPRMIVTAETESHDDDNGIKPGIQDDKSIEQEISERHRVVTADLDAAVKWQQEERERSERAREMMQREVEERSINLK